MIFVLIIIYIFFGTLSYQGLEAMDFNTYEQLTKYEQIEYDGANDDIWGNIIFSMIWPITWIVITSNYLAKALLDKIINKL